MASPQGASAVPSTTASRTILATESTSATTTVPEVAGSRSPTRSPEAAETSANLAPEADDVDDHDSALGDVESVVSSTTSINSSIFKHRQENGRTYHAYKDGKWLLPNDEGENDRLDLQHHVYALTYEGRLYTSNFDKAQLHRVLDIGTGTGIWAIDFGDEHPESKVLGVDLSPSQPQFVPPNVSFEVDDLEDNWTFSDKFDFIHCRMMTGGIQNWPKFFDQVFENLVPGGYFEISDCCFPLQSDDGTLDGTILQKWANISLEATQRIGRDLDSAKTYKAELNRVGFTDIEEKMFVWPMNRWPKDPKYKELGLWTCENLTSGLSGVSMALFTRVLGMTPEEVELFLAQVRKDMKDTKIHAYFPIYTYCARKPSLETA